MTDKLIRLTTALAVLAVAVIAAIISYQHAYELIRAHGETGFTARLLPLTVDGLIWAASMVILDASRRNQRVPRLAAWSLGCAIAATISANLAPGLNHGPIGALISAWPALALVGSFELLMHLIKTSAVGNPGQPAETLLQDGTPADAPPEPARAPTLEQTVRELHQAGRSQRAIAREFSMDRRKVKNIIDRGAWVAGVPGNGVRAQPRASPVTPSLYEARKLWAHSG
jgi:hypothetical protein